MEVRNVIPNLKNQNLPLAKIPKYPTPPPYINPIAQKMILMPNFKRKPQNLNPKH